MRSTGIGQGPSAGGCARLWWGALASALWLALSSVPGAAAEPTEEGEIVLNPGDAVRITMVQDPDVMFEGEVSVMGTVVLPYLREFRLAGLTSEQAAKALSEAYCRELYQEATLSVVLLRKAPGKVYVYGAIKQPGVVALPPTGEITAMQLISEMGGLTSWAAPERAYILRQPDVAKPAERIPLDLTEVFAEGGLGRVLVPLRNGDVFFVPGMDGGARQIMTNDDCQIVVVGEVNAPGIVRFAPGEQRTVMRAIFKAAGFSKFAKSTQVRLIRYGKDGNRSEEKINVSEIIDDGMLHKDVELSPGDMLIVPQKLINF
ncbi:MAG: SLBB domain-containing protein [Lentisphaeria bacterium]|nr:SLBB domain-containing protein [Lentisphaeria bacterium]